MSKMFTLYTEYGQSIWLDYIDRNLLRNGGLKALVAEGLRGVTSNPTIFHKATADSGDYDDAIRDLLQADHGISNEILYEWLSIQDVQMAADILKLVYESSEGIDGYVSLEVSPYLAYQTEATVAAARHLWQAVDRPNLMIKVPATVPGLLAIEQLIAQGINVNVTLLFSTLRYQAVRDAFLRGLAQNPHPERTVSVASFFVSRLDTKVDVALEDVATPEALDLRGQIAVASTKLAYRDFKESTASARFEAQSRRGARPQRPLWASTSTKNPAYSKLLYVEQLIGPDTVNTVTPATLDAFQSRGELFATLEQDVSRAQQRLEALDALGIDLERIADELEQEGVKKFVDSHERLLASLQTKRFAVAKQYAGE